MRGLEGYREVMEMSKQLCHSFRPAPRPVKRLPPVLMRLSCSISPSLDAHYSALLVPSSSYSHSITLCFTSSASLAGCNRICVNSGKHSPCLMIKDKTSDWPIDIAFLIDSIGRQKELR